MRASDKRDWKRIAGLYMMVIAVVVAFWPFQARAQEVMGAVWCDRPEQIESFVRLQASEGISQQAAAARVNRQAESPTACVPIMAVAATGRELKQLVAGDTLYVILEVVIIGAVKDDIVHMIEPIKLYAARAVARLEKA